MFFDLTTDAFDSELFAQCIRKKTRRVCSHVPIGDTIRVSYWTDDDAFDCVYRFVTAQTVYDMIAHCQPLNLKGAYIKDFDISCVCGDQPLIALNASYSFFGGTVNFAHAMFTSDVDFTCAVFSGGVSFAHAEFHGDAIFEGTNFGSGYVMFDGASFQGGQVYFGSALLDGAMRFCKATFGESDIRFIGASIVSLYFYRNTFPAHVDLRMRNIETLVVQDCVIEKTLRCDRYKGKHITCGALSFLDTVNLGQIVLSWELNDVKNAIANAMYHDFETDTGGREFTHAEKAAQFRMLKENFHDIGYYEDEDKAYRAYMQGKTNSPRKFAFKLLGLVGGYGTRPLTIFVAALAAILGFAILYNFSMNFERIFPSRFFESLYFSAITFLTIGYGEITPTEAWPAILTGIEGFCGLFLMSYFTVAVARKILR